MFIYKKPFLCYMNQHPIGVFDSGYGGLTILDKIRGLMPEYDYI